MDDTQTATFSLDSRRAATTGFDGFERNCRTQLGDGVPVTAVQRGNGRRLPAPFPRHLATGICPPLLCVAERRSRPFSRPRGRIGPVSGPQFW